VNRPASRNGRIAGAVALALAVASFGCDARTAPASSNAHDGLVARRGRLERVVLLTGELKSVDAERILVPRTRAGGRIPIRWLESDGTLVEAGQRVLELDSTQFSSELEQKRLDESRALNELMRKEADLALELADKQFQLDRRTIESSKAELEAEVPPELRSRREHQEKQLALARARTEHEKAQEELQASRDAAGAELEELRLELQQSRNEIRIAEEAIAKLTLVAPSSGILVVHENPMEGRKLQVGDTVWVGLALVSIPDLSRMQVEARLSDVDDGKIEVGMSARCTLDTYPERVFGGTIDEIAPIAKEQGRDSLRRAFNVVILLDESDPDTMRPGMSVKVEVVGDPAEEALLVPRAALDLSGDTPRVLLADGSAAEVRLGPCDAMHCVVRDGLAEGARLGRRG